MVLRTWMQNILVDLGSALYDLVAIELNAAEIDLPTLSQGVET